MRTLVNPIPVGFELPASAIGLPTTGCTITDVQLVKNEENGFRTGDFYRVSGAVHPADPNAYDINFQAGFPVQWNGRLLQYGGGGLDGNVAPIEWVSVGQSFFGPSQLSKGYISLYGDSGHTQPAEDPNSCRWMLNREARENYAYKAFKKLKDVAVCLAEYLYGGKPERVYFAGGSNGGREALKVIQNFPEDYDGAVCLYPVVNYVLKFYKDTLIGNKLRQLGEKAWMSAGQYAGVQKLIIGMLDGLDGAEDGLVSDFEGARSREPEVLEALCGILTPEQLAFMKYAAEDFAFPFAMSGGAARMPGYHPFQGAPMIDKYTNWFGPAPDARENFSVDAGYELLRCLIMGDPEYNVADFDPIREKERVLAASRLMDAGADDLDAFKARGGKLILVHGLTDSLIPVQSSIDYYNKLRAHYGEGLSDFLRFYTVPGYGHGMGEMFWLDADLIAVLDAWVCEGKSPDVLVVSDANDQVNRRTRPLYQYPAYPVYNGEGDINLAGSFHPERK